MEEIRLMAFDLDGTLLNEEKKITPRCQRALLECQRRGIALLFCSGRSFEAQTAFVGGTGLAPAFASANGARIDLSMTSGIFREAPIEEKLSRRIYRHLLGTGIYFMAYTRGRSYMLNRDRAFLSARRTHVPGWERFPGGAYETVLDAKRAERECALGTYKYVCFAEDYDPRFDEIREAFSGLGLSISSSWKDNLEIMSPGVDKGFALRTVAAQGNIPLKQCMAFGDNTNDVPMLKAAGWPVVMGNGEESVKPLARILAPENTKDGVARVIEEYVLQ